MMKRFACRLSCLAALLAAAAVPALAQPGAAVPGSAQPAAATAPQAAQGARGGAQEEAVQRTRIEDDNARIDELRVRGQNRRIAVQPKKGGAAYEVLPADGSRDLSNEGGRGAAGQRVWHLLSF
ncbi:DUF2782 domain-containing protein [Aquabacterium sp. A7-Y]|uniref:hypothetical protein n=1 Tax=Aquabacterium sp. A7-Y TaxID=1349605 RepID=UPI00223E73ED|nr:hypothetical protein [Aquabacterium sp. A7-Y]MCW7536368.1 DUF2782 domain-containing protein [Aquabacterium sp. A7-Y]